MSDIKKKSFFERLTGSMRVTDDSMFDHMDNTEPVASPSINTNAKPYEKTIKVNEERDPFQHTYVEEEEEEDGELPIDLYQTDSEIIIQAFVAGVRPDELQITITRDTITLKGSRKMSQSVDEEDYAIRELYWGTFSRTVELPAEVEPEEAEAVEKHGLIIIKLPKIDKQKRASIRVKSI